MQHLVHHVNIRHRNQLIGCSVCPLDARHWLVVDEVAYTFVHVAVAIHLVAVQVGALYL